MSRVTGGDKRGDAADRALDRFAELVKTQSAAAVDLEEAAPPQWQRDAMRRAAFLRVFDRGLWEAVIAGRRLIDDFIRLPGIEPYDLTRETWRVKDSAAAQALEEWSPQQAEIRRFCEQAYRYLKTRSDHPPLEAIRLRLPLEAEAAAALIEFNELFDSADRAFDLATCHALVQMLRELDILEIGGRRIFLKLLNEAQRLRCDELIPYMAARGRFIDEYGKTTSYLERRVLDTLTENFVKTGGDWLLPIHGPGGRGKTMYLQWLMARHSVPARIPVARADFDDINVAKLGQHPELLLLRFAEQLSPQIAGAPFADMLVSYGKYAAILLPPSRVVNPSALDSLENELNPNLEAELMNRFASSVGSRLTLIILDTVEEGLLHFPDALRNVLVILRTTTVLSGSGLKTILAGRYNLEDRGFLNPHDPKPVEIPPFDDEEAEAYLTQHRRIENPELRPAIVRKAGGNPFILSLIADLVAAKDIHTPEAVDALDPEFAYLIRRVIDRIPDSEFALRWVVRYGVVPRRLTREFLTGVMLPALRDELAARGRFDRVQEFAESFPRGQAFDPAALWDRLQRYAAPNSWLRASGDELRFQPEIVKPMRNLLAREAVFYVLHREACNWFEGKASVEKDAGAWAAWTAEQIYHRCWLRAAEINDPLVPTVAKTGEDYVGAMLETCLADPRAASGHARRALLEAVTGFVDAEPERAAAAHPRIEQGAASVIPPQVAAWAFLHWAKSAAGIGFGPCGVEEPALNIRNAVEIARKLYTAEEWPSDLAGLILMAVNVVERQYDRAQAMLVGAPIGGFSDAAEEYSFRLLLARAFAGTDIHLAEQQYDFAHRLLFDHFNRPDARPTPTIGPDGFQPWEIRLEAGREFANLRRPDRALAQFQLALREQAESAAVEVDLAEVQAETGAYEDALESTAHVASLAEADRVERIGSWARAAQGRKLPPEPAILPSQRSPMQMEAFARRRATLYWLGYAASALEHAIVSYRALGDVRRAEAALLAQVRMLVDQAGDWARAEAALARAGPLQSPALDLEHIHLRLEMGLGIIATHSDLANIFLRLQNEDGVREGLAALVDLLRRVEPPSARYDYLRMFRWLPELEGGEEFLPALAGLVPHPTLDSPDFFARVFDHLEMLRCLKPADARSRFLAASAAANRSEFDVWHRIVDTARRLGADLPDVDRVLAYAQEFSSEPLCAATLIGFAAGAIERGAHRDAILAMEGWERPIPQELMGTEVEAEFHVNVAALGEDDSKHTELNTAVEILNRLGQQVRARRLAARYLAPGATASSTPQQDPNRTVILLAATPDPWGIAPEPNARSIVSFNHVKALLEPQADVVRALRFALGEQRFKNIVELAFDNAAAGAALPWEWAFRESAVCFRSCAALAQAQPISPRHKLLQRFWPKLPMALRRIFSALVPVRVCILRETMVRPEYAQRTFENVSRRTLDAIYQSQGAKVFPLPSPQRSDMEAVFQAHKPNVIHIQAPVLEVERALALNVMVTVGADPQLVTPEYLNSLLRSARGPSALPVVILDSPSAPDDSETVRQLLLRNRFAAELAMLGVARAVFCTGLFQRSAVQLAGERLAAELCLTPRLSQLLSIFRQEFGAWDRFSGLGAALFAHDPSGLLR